MSSEPTEDRASNQDEEIQPDEGTQEADNNQEFTQEDVDYVTRWKTTIQGLRELQRMYKAQLRQKEQQQAQQEAQQTIQETQEASQEANQENNKEKSEEKKELEELYKLQKMAPSKALKATLEAPSKSVRKAVKGYTEKYLHFPLEEPLPPVQEEEEEEKEGGKKGGGKGKGSRKKPTKKELEEAEQKRWQEQKQKLQEMINLPLRERLKRRLSNALQNLKKGASNFARKKAPILTRKAAENVPPPPTPYSEVTGFVESVVINVPESREKNLLMSFAMLAGMYGIGGVLIFIDNLIVDLWQYQWGQALVILMIPIILIHLITGFMMWFALYMTTFSSISAIFTNIASKIWTQANYHHTLSPRAVVYYALAMVLYMATAKVWVGIAVGYLMALPSFLFFAYIQEVIVTALILIGALTIKQILAGFVLLIYAIVALIYLTLFLIFSFMSLYWSRYTTNSIDIHRPLAVWLILVVRELLAPQMAYLAVAGFAIYAGIQAALSVGTQKSNYKYLNMLPAVIILATAPMGTATMLSQMVINVVDQAFNYMASIDKWNVLMVSAQGLAKWLLSVIPPW